MTPLTLTDEATDAIRARGLCPTCYAKGVMSTMIRVGKHSWVCPRQQDPGISQAARESVKETAAARTGQPF